MAQTLGVSETVQIADVRAEAATWLKANRLPGLERGGAHEPYDHEPSPLREEWVGRCREGRWLCLSWPEAYGGRGLDAMQISAVNEEFARAGVPRPVLGMGETLVSPAVLAHGTEEQKARFLPRILSGEDVYCQGFSEPGAGSDLAGLRTVGEIDGDQVVITGQKVWTSGAHRADTIFTLCRTDPDAPKHKGISYVLVPMRDNNITVSPLRQMAGAYGFNQVFYDGARAPLTNVIGGVNNGWRVAQTTLGSERGGSVTTQYLGYMSEWEALRAEAHERGRLAEATVRQDMAAAYSAVRIMQFQGQRMMAALARTGSLGPAASADKVFWSEYHRRFGELAMSILGPAATVRPDGDGYRTSQWQRIFLESRARCIARGSSEIQRNIIGEKVLGLPREPGGAG